MLETSALIHQLGILKKQFLWTYCLVRANPV
jgi:hypothetical protein